MLPAIVLLKRDVDLDEWSPLGTFWLLDQAYARLRWGAIALGGVALDA